MTKFLIKSGREEIGQIKLTEKGLIMAGKIDQLGDIVAGVRGLMGLKKIAIGGDGQIERDGNGKVRIDGEIRVRKETLPEATKILRAYLTQVLAGAIEVTETDKE